MKTNVALLVSLLMVVACAPKLDPKAVEAVTSLEKFSAEAVAGDCVALKAGFEALHANESLKAVSDEALLARVKAADEKVKPLLDACAAPAPVEAAPAPVEAVPAPVEAVPAPVEAAPAL
jgi:hypothetical protein